MSNPATIPVILSAVRTPIGKFLGSLSRLSAPALGSIVLQEAVARAGITGGQIDEVIMGNVLQGGVGQAPARQAAMGAELPGTIPAMTVNKVCGSGLKAVMLAAQAIRAEDARCIVAGGMESMSNAPFYLYGVRSGVKAGNQTAVDGMIHDGLWDSFGDRHTGGGNFSSTLEMASLTSSSICSGFGLSGTAAVATPRQMSLRVLPSMKSRTIDPSSYS